MATGPGYFSAPAMDADAGDFAVAPVAHPAGHFLGLGIGPDQGAAGEQGAALFADSDHAVGDGQRGGDRLVGRDAFDARFGAGDHRFGIMFGRRDHRGDFGDYFAQHRVGVGEQRGDPVLLSRPLQPFWVGLDERYQLDIGQRGIDVGVDLSKAAEADDGDAVFFSLHGGRISISYVEGAGGYSPSKLDGGQDDSGHGDHRPHQHVESGVDTLTHGAKLILHLLTYILELTLRFLANDLKLQMHILTYVLDLPSHILKLLTHFLAHVLYVFAQVGYAPVKILRGW